MLNQPWLKHRIYKGSSKHSSINYIQDHIFIEGELKLILIISWVKCVVLILRSISVGVPCTSSTIFLSHFLNRMVYLPIVLVLPWCVLTGTWFTWPWLLSMALSAHNIDECEDIQCHMFIWMNSKLFFPQFWEREKAIHFLLLC